MKNAKVKFRRDKTPKLVFQKRPWEKGEGGRYEYPEDEQKLNRRGRRLKEKREG